MWPGAGHLVLIFLHSYRGVPPHCIFRESAQGGFGCKGSRQFWMR